MAEAKAERVKVVLRWVQILDKLEPFFDEYGEFRFTTRVTADDGEPAELHLPEKGHYQITDRPGWNRHGFDKVIFEGDVANRLVVELEGEELDFLSDNDRLEDYKRIFEGPPTLWLGRKCPGDEAPADPENLKNWRVCYEIMRA
jgi:hypothetical protein